MSVRGVNLGFSIILFMLGVFCLWFAWEYGLLPNYGLESGYYGQFNRVKHVIESMPNIVIKDYIQHKDVSLEDFSFILLVDGIKEVEVRFWEDSSQMKEKSKTRLREFISEKIGSRF